MIQNVVFFFNYSVCNFCLCKLLTNTIWSEKSDSKAICCTFTVGKSSVNCVFLFVHLKTYFSVLKNSVFFRGIFNNLIRIFSKDKKLKVIRENIKQNINLINTTELKWFSFCFVFLQKMFMDCEILRCSFAN